MRCSLRLEQSVPVAAKNLYYDYETTDTGDPANRLVRIVATPKDIVDSYVATCDLLGLDLRCSNKYTCRCTALYEVRRFNTRHPVYYCRRCGDSIDVGIFDATLRVTGTASEEGGNSLTEAIAKATRCRTRKSQYDKSHPGYKRRYTTS